MIRKLFDDLFIITGIGSANIFLLLNKKIFSLIDTGIFMKTKQLIDDIQSIELQTADLQTIYLTHCHCDHIGGVRELLSLSNAKVAAHLSDIPYIIQKDIIKGPYHNMMIEEQKTMKRLHCNINNIDIELKDNDTINEIGGLKVISVPGHTPGSIAFYQKNKQIMFFGDVIRNNINKGLTIGIPEKFNSDTEQTIKDAKKLLNYPIQYALFSHGEPIYPNANSILSKLLN